VKPRALSAVILVSALGMFAAATEAAPKPPLASGIGEPNNALRLVGGAVVFYDSEIYRDSPSGSYVLKSKAPGKPPRVLARIIPTYKSGWGWPGLDFAFAASPQATVVAREELYTDSEDDELLFVRDTLDAYSPGGGRILHSQCTGNARSLSMALAGTALATYQTDCGQSDLAIRDLSTGGGVVTRFPDADSGDLDATVAIAGDLVAYPTGATGVSVANWRTGSLLYHVERPDLDSYEIALAADGTLVIALTAPAGNSCTRAAVFEPSDQSGRTLPDQFCVTESPFRLVGRDLAFVTRRGSAWRLEVTNIDTGAHRTVARFATTSVRAFDFDGVRVAWQEQRCEDYAVFLQRASAPPHPAGPISCPIRLGRRGVRVTGKRRIVIPVRCPRGCTVEEATMTLRRLGSNIDYAGIRLRPGRTGQLRFTLESKQLRRLRRLRRTRATIVATSITPNDKRAYYRLRLNVHG
jgi:hypothetical protein